MAAATNRAERQDGNRSQARDDGRNDDDVSESRGERGEREPDDKKADQKKKPSPFQNPWVKIGLVVAVLALIAGGIIWWLIARHYEDTDDAFIDTHIVRLAPQIEGQVTAVLAKDNQLVHQGDLLIAINSADAQAKLDQILAQKAQAQTALAQALASAAGIAAQAENANRDFARYVALKKTAPAAVAQQQMDQAQATARSADAQRMQSDAQIAGARAQLKSYDAQIAAATAQSGLYSHRRAHRRPCRATKRWPWAIMSRPARNFMAIVPLQLWVTANFKETQLDLMRVGQHVRRHG